MTYENAIDDYKNKGSEVKALAVDVAIGIAYQERRGRLSSA